VPAPEVEAAGGVLWRGDPANPEVALVHRPRYDDWSLPKGKLDPGEHPLLGALREIEEETGSTARPGRRLGSLRYPVPEGRKRVRYWACEATGGRFQANREVDELWWAPVAEAHARLDPAHDARVIERFAADTRRTRPLAVVRHASAGDKRAWAGDDADRPLDPTGLAQSVTIGALLTAYDVELAGSADVRRCRDTLEPFARSAGVEVEVLPATTAAAFDVDPDAGICAVLDLAASTGGAVAWCGQREVIPQLVAALCARLGGGVDPGRLAELGKGRLLVLHLDPAGQVAEVERLPAAAT
jgi:8-oxo-dGTP pyrophosphatase MutT (NUDIX family)/phosphohistidine phosphatase SixA